MKILNSKTDTMVTYSFGKYRHNVNYKADNTNPAAVKIESLEDNIFTLIAQDVISAPVGQLIYDGAQITAGSIAVNNDFAGIVDDLKAIITGIQTGTEVVERDFPIEVTDTTIE